jgi:acyl-coenzyme A synthetase/AMP-(fatty) acid ligase
VELPVCLLAVLKAGGCALLLDPEHPAQHLARILADVSPRWTLATRETMRALPGDARQLAIDDADMIEALTHARADDPTDRDRPSPTTDSAAYVACTAGTSGPPRGVVATHGGLRNLLSAMESALALTDAQTFVALSSVGADLSVMELLQPLSLGARLMLVSADELLYPRLLARTIESLPAPVVQGTPMRLRALARHLYQPVPGLTFLVGRDTTLTHESMQAWQRVAQRVLHLYGTTETTIWNTLGVGLGLGASISAGGAARRAPIGRPMDETRVYLLDDHLQLVPTGVIGDLYVAGAGIARGYIGPPSMTADRFVSDPFGAAGTRMVRTGDRARWLQDGALELIGRRTEAPGADDRLLVETALRANPDLADAYVAAYRNGAAQPGLVAYAIVPPNSRGSVGRDDLRRFVERALPAALITHDIVELDDLPLTPNGTLDRDALPPPIVRSRMPGAPESPREQALRGLFGEVLGIAPVGLDDNFFALGGNSLLVTHLLNRVRTRLGIEIDIRTFFDAPTVASLNRRLEHYASEAG